MIDANVGGTEVEVLVFDFRGPARCEAPLDAGPDDPTGAIGTAGACLKQSPIRQNAHAGRTAPAQGYAALRIEEPIIRCPAHTTRQQGKILEARGGRAWESRHRSVPPSSQSRPPLFLLDSTCKVCVSKRR